MRTVWWDSDTGQVKMIDQRKLPLVFEIADFSTVDEVAEAINVMVVRGAPAIGAAGGFGMALAAQNSDAVTAEALLGDLQVAKATLDEARPTAVNLTWATARVLRLLKAAEHGDVKGLSDLALAEAQRIADDDIEINKRLGRHGAEIVPAQANILHHCNTGALATVDYGTALGVVRAAVELGKKVHVLCVF